MYGSPTDVKIKKIDSGRVAGMDIYEASFTTLTPAMRERSVGHDVFFPEILKDNPSHKTLAMYPPPPSSDRNAYISASIVGDGLFLLVTTTTAARFRKLDTLRQVADSFSAIPAPKSTLNQRK